MIAEPGIRGRGKQGQGEKKMEHGIGKILCSRGQASFEALLKRMP
jgi:hypothetical protein